jgi:transposase
MKAASADVGAKLAQACDERAASRRQLARQFRVSVAFIQQRLRRRRLTGRLAAVHTGGRRGLLDADVLALGARLIREQNDLTLAERCERVAEVRGVHVSIPTMSRAVRRLRLPYTKSCMPPSGTLRVCTLSGRSTST